MMKRAQTELLGFVMVVAIIAIAIVFIVGFLAATESTNVRNEFIDKQLAVNLNDAMLETSTMCRGIKVKDLLLNCAQTKNYACDGLNPCEYLNQDVFPKLLDVTVGESGRNSSYTYRACVQGGASNQECYDMAPTGPNQLVNFSNGDCSRSAITPGIFPLPTRSGNTVYSVLKICR